MNVRPVMTAMRDDHLTKPVPGFTGPTKLQFVPAKTWRRAIGFIADILFFSFIVAAPLEQELVAAAPEPFAGTTALGYGLAAILLSFFFAYAVAAEYLVGQTLGMLLVNIRTIPELSFFQTIVRNLFLIPIFPFVLLWIADPLSLLFTGARLTERWSGTNTVEEVSS